MNFSDILNNIKKAAKPSKPVDAYAMVNGIPTNEIICDSMLEGVKESPDVSEHVKSIGKGMGFSEAETNLFWG
jgi:hypothetical protein